MEQILKAVVASDPFGSSIIAATEESKELIKAALLYADEIQIANIGYGVAIPVKAIRSPNIKIAPDGTGEQRRTHSIEVNLELSVTTLHPELGLISLVPRPETSLSITKAIDELIPAKQRGLIVDMPVSESTADFSEVLPPLRTNDLRAVSHDDYIRHTISVPMWLSGVLTAITQPGVVPVIGCFTRPNIEVETLQATPNTIANSSLAVGLISRLPSFPDATIDEILDIRESLSRPLIRFRAEVVRLADEVAANKHVEMRQAVEALWVERVGPSLLEIEELVQENRYLVRLLDRAKPTEVLAELGAVAVSVSQFTGVARILSAASTAATPFVETFRTTWLERRKLARQHALTFLHDAERGLKRRERRRR